MKNETPVQSFGSGGVMSRQHVWKVVGLTLLVCGSLYAQQINSFDVLLPYVLPDGTTTAYNTFPTAINPAGVIAGSYQDDYTLVYQGFVRSPGNPPTYTVFDPSGTTDSVNTIVTGINLAGTVTGYYTDASGVIHGFLRASKGRITTIDDPGAGTSPGEGTFPLGINVAGVITGWYYDTNFGVHGFLRTPGGTFTTIDPPTSLATTPQAIKLTGEIMGFYVSADPVTGFAQVHFFLRGPGVKITTIDPPGLVTANQSDSAGSGGSSLSGFIASGAQGSINDAGSVVGYFFDGSGYQGFLRTPNGKFTPINEPNSANSADYTFVNGINLSGKIIGQYLDSTSTAAFHGFVAVPPYQTGNYTTIDPPNSRLTAATAINTVGEITGWYEDATSPSAIYHGFLRSP